MLQTEDKKRNQTTKRNPLSLKDRERAHFDNLHVNPLAFLEDDGSWFKKATIKFLISRWDGHLKYLPKDALKDRLVLDACCGNPRVVCWMNAKGATAFGCDISIKMMTMGNSSGSSYTLGEKVELSPVRWAIADCERLPYAPGAFDTVTCFQALHHVNHDMFLRECRRVLKDGGVIIVSDPNGDHFLRKAGTYIGKKLRLLSDDETTCGKKVIIAELLNAGFDVKWTRSINFLSETVFLFEEVLRKKHPFVSSLLRLSLLALYPIDHILDHTLFRIFPSLAWRNIFYAVKTND